MWSGVECGECDGVWRSVAECGECGGVWQSVASVASVAE